MTDELVLTESHPDGVVEVRLNRPPMNPLSHALLTALGDVAADLGGDPAVKAVVVLGSEKAL
ncbi:MAG: enoyl-CoA hydratase-related protein, partial [Acidimicrobiia bacterium]